MTSSFTSGKNLFHLFEDVHEVAFLHEEVHTIVIATGSSSVRSFGEFLSASNEFMEEAAFPDP